MEKLTTFGQVLEETAEVLVGPEKGKHHQESPWTYEPTIGAFDRRIERILDPAMHQQVIALHHYH